MIRVVLLDDFDDGVFRGAVRLADEIVVTFPLDLDLVETIQVAQEDTAPASRGHHGHIL